MDSKPRPLLTPTLLAFMGMMVLANVAGRMHQPLLPLYLQSLGAGVAQVGLFFTLSAIAPLALQILGGWLSDSVGRLQAIALGSLAGVVSYLVFLVAPSWQWLLIAVAAGAMASSFVGPSYQAFIAEQSTEATRGRVYGIVDGIFMVVGVIGPPIGGYLSQRFGFKPMLAVAGVLYTAATVGRLWMARDARRKEFAPRPAPSLAGLRTNLLGMIGLVTAGGVVTWIWISDGVRDVAYGLSSQLQPLYLQNLMGLTNTEIGWLTSIASFTTMLLVSPAGWLSDRRGERVGIVAGLLALSVGMAVFLNSRVFAGFAAAWFLYGVGEALATPAYNALISKVVPTALRGTAFGLFSTSLGIISLPAPFIGAQLWERFGPQVPFYVPLAATLLVLPVIWVKFRLPRVAANAPVAAGASTGAD